MSIKFAQQEKDALDVISKNPGITTLSLSVLLADASGTTPQQMTGMLSAMAKKHSFVRVKAAENGKFTYKCYMTVPPGVDPKLFEPRHVNKQKVHDLVDPKHYLERPKNGVTTQSMLQHSAGSAHEEGPPPDLKFVPPLKPGTFTVDLELPNGRVAKFTINEARRMYEQLNHLFAQG
jgi:hypothetical protein